MSEKKTPIAETEAICQHCQGSGKKYGFLGNEPKDLCVICEGRGTVKR